MYLFDEYSSRILLLIFNPPTNSPYCIQADILVDCISSYSNDDLVFSNCSTILGDINLVDVCCATITAHSDNSEVILEKVESLNSLPLVFEPTYQCGSILDIILTSTPKLFTVCVDDSCTWITLLFLHGFPFLSPCSTKVLKRPQSIQLLLSPLSASIKTSLLVTMIFVP